MKYIITPALIDRGFLFLIISTIIFIFVTMNNKLEQFVIKYLNKFYGDLKEYTTDKRPNRVFYVKNNRAYMEKMLRNNVLWVDYDTIWEDLENIFGLDRYESQRIITNWVKETYNLRGIRYGNIIFVRDDEWKTLVKQTNYE